MVKYIAAVVMVALVGFGMVKAAQAYTCTTNCYGNSCTTNCF